MNKKIHFLWITCTLLGLNIALPILGQSLRPAKKTDMQNALILNETITPNEEKSDSSPVGPTKEKKVEREKKESLKDLVITDVVVPITKDTTGAENLSDKEKRDEH